MLHMRMHTFLNYPRCHDARVHGEGVEVWDVQAQPRLQVWMVDPAPRGRKISVPANKRILGLMRGQHFSGTEFYPR